MHSRHYTTYAQLTGHTGGPINTVAFSPSCDILASGGYDCIRLWDTVSTQSLDTPLHPPLRGPITRLKWITQARTGQTLLCFGTGRGYLVLWSMRDTKDSFDELVAKRIGGGGEVLSIAWLSSDPTSTRIATSTRDQFVQVWHLDEHSQLHNVFAVKLETTIPVTVEFVGSSSRDVYVFGLSDGLMFRLQGENGNELEKKDIGSIMAYASVRSRDGIFVVDNADNGFDLRDLQTGNLIQNFPTGKPAFRWPKQVEFGEGANVIICGSDHGVVYVFDKDSGEVREKLQHAKEGAVQTVACATTPGGVRYIATASSGAVQQPQLTVWQRPAEVVEVPVLQSTSFSLQNILRKMMWVLIWIAALGFVVQNLNTIEALSHRAIWRRLEVGDYVPKGASRYEPRTAWRTSGERQSPYYGAYDTLDDEDDFEADEDVEVNEDRLREALDRWRRDNAVTRKFMQATVITSATPGETKIPMSPSSNM